MLVGPAATRRERAKFAEVIRKNPRNYMAQPALKLSTGPTLCGNSIEPRHLDLRPFILQGQNHYVTPGGLTRVALREVWKDHPRYTFISNQKRFYEKVAAVLIALEQALRIDSGVG